MHAQRRPARQRGVGLLATLIVLGVVASLALLTFVDSAAQTRSRREQAARDMGTIRDALVARAAGDANRPGSLPCPDYNGDGVADGSLCTSPYIGWVPWKTLDLPDLRDAAGERFWYALSVEFRDHSSAGTLNSDTSGSLSISGTPSASNVIAIIFAPGAPLATQNRDPANTDALAVRAQYLDASNNDGNTGYVAGPATATFNDELLAITHGTLMPVVEQRVARQARKCLQNFAAQTGADGHFPFAAPLYDLGFDDDFGTYYGRIPKTLWSTNSALGTSLAWPADDPQDPGRTGTEECFRDGTWSDPSWWDQWRELLFYRVAPGYAPNAGSVGCGSCLTVNNAGQVTAVVIVAGRRHTASPSQTRANWWDKDDANNYLERAPSTPGWPVCTVSNDNGLASGSLCRRPRAATYAAATGNFNDRVECLSETGAWPCN